MRGRAGGMVLPGMDNSLGVRFRGMSSAASVMVTSLCSKSVSTIKRTVFYWQRVRLVANMVMHIVSRVYRI